MPTDKKKRKAEKSVENGAENGVENGVENSGCNCSSITSPAKKSVKKGQNEAATGSVVQLQVTDSFFRCLSGKKWIGAHVSAAKGLQNAIFNSLKIGGQSFALFLKSQRKWTSPPLDPKVIASFKEAMVMHKFEAKHVLPHGSYLINLGNPDIEKRTKSYDAFLDDLKRCELLGLDLYNFHPVNHSFTLIHLHPL